MGSNRQGAISSDRITFYIFAAVLFFAPMFQGLFFRQQIYKAGLAVAGLFIWYLWSSREKWDFDFKKLTILDIGVLGLLAAYVVSTFTAVKVLDAVDMDLKMAIYLMVYIVAAGLARTDSGRSKLLTVLYVAGLAISIIGIAAYAGVDIKDGVLHGRISSTFQYPNALGAYLAAIGMVGVYLSVIIEKLPFRLLVSAGNVALFTALFGTSSRGTFLALTAACLVFILFQPSAYRLTIFGALLLNLVFGAATGYLIAGKAGNPVVLGFVVLMSFFYAAVYFGWNKLSNTTFMSNKKLLWVSMIVLVAVLIAVGFKIMDNTFVERITNINLEDRNVVERGYFYSDALKIIKTHPVLGVGGGGWRSLYKAYQSYGYNSTQVHNFYLQTWVEAGIAGFLSIVFIIIGVFWSFVKRIKGQTENRPLDVTVAAAVVVLALQSAIDFTLSYGAIAVLLWTFLAIMRTPSEEEQNLLRAKTKGAGGTKSITLLTGSCLAVAVIIFCLALLASFNYEEKSLEAISNRDNEARLAYVKKSVAFNPFYADNYANLSLMERKKFKREKNPDYLKTALVYINKAISRDKGNPGYRAEKISILLSLKDFESAVKEAEIAYMLAPWDQESYNLLARVYLSSGEYYIEHGDKERAKIYISKTLNVPKMLKKKMNTLSVEEMKLWAGEKPAFDDKLQRYITKAIVLLRQMS